MAHILVTGANGFIGSHLVRKLLELKKKENWEEDIVCLVRSTSDLSWLKGLDVKLVIGDLRDEETLVNAVQGATYIYHLGADLYTINRKRFLETNTEGTRNLLKAAAKYADSVYFGVKSFNMRMRSENIELKDLPKIVNYCNNHNLKTYLTTNILIYDNELQELEKLIRKAKDMCLEIP